MMEDADEKQTVYDSIDLERGYHNGTDVDAGRPVINSTGRSRITISLDTLPIVAC